MRQVEAITDNEKIAVFMGYNIYDHASYRTAEKDGQHSYEKRYNKDWGLLMEVVENIENLGYQTTMSTIKHQHPFKDEICATDFYFNIYGDKEIINVGAEDKQEAVYKGVVGFINWHNEQKQ